MRPPDDWDICQSISDYLMTISLPREGPPRFVKAAARRQVLRHFQLRAFVLRQERRTGTPSGTRVKGGGGDIARRALSAPGAPRLVAVGYVRLGSGRPASRSVARR
jgi:hypothetical protein